QPNGLVDQPVAGRQDLGPGDFDLRTRVVRGLHSVLRHRRPAGTRSRIHSMVSLVVLIVSCGTKRPLMASKSIPSRKARKPSAPVQTSKPTARPIAAAT